MDACITVEKEVDKVVSKLQNFEAHSSHTLRDLIESVSSMEQNLETGNEEELKQAHYMVLETYTKKIKDVTSSLSAQHRDIHSTVHRMGKAIEKNFNADFAAASREGLFDDEKSQRILNHVVCEHLLRRGYTEIAEELVREANLKRPENYKLPFIEINEILDQLKKKNLEPALKWVGRNREKLTAQRSQLEINLHRLQFLALIQNGSPLSDLVNYARQHFQHLSVRHEKDIQELMGCLLYARNNSFQFSPYKDLFDNNMWTEICHLFVKDACALNGLSVNSPLIICVNAGCTALPSLLTIKQVMQQRQVNMWCSMDELPIEIQLGRKNQFHSIFACPILRQQSSETNPPMRLTCGHVISKDALQKLCSATKLKCPYCPQEQHPNEARQLHF